MPVVKRTGCELRQRGAAAGGSAAAPNLPSRPPQLTSAAVCTVGGLQHWSNSERVRHQQASSGSPAKAAAAAGAAARRAVTADLQPPRQGAWRPAAAVQSQPSAKDAAARLLGQPRAGSSSTRGAGLLKALWGALRDRGAHRDRWKMIAASGKRPWPKTGLRLHARPMRAGPKQGASMRPS